MLRPLRRAKENQPEKQCQEVPEKVPNPDESRGGENPGSGGRPNVVPFQLTRYSKNDDSEPRQAPDPFGGFRADPKRVVRRAARTELRDDQSDPIQEHSIITSSFSLVVVGSR